ncbi:MAG TPA: histidine kinase [Prolixibacteraceae bacterium]|nr:histidine kinase [Prolixibacteraceae bacterium]
MEHPVTANRISGLIYWFFPVAVGIIQAVFNSYYQILPVTVAFIDGLTFYLVLGLLGIAVWYVVRYNDPEKSAVIQIFASHVAASVVFTSLWIVSSGIIVKILINNPLYDQYLNDLIPERIIGGIIYYVLLVSIYYTYVYSQHNREKQLREAEWQHQIRKTQLSALKSQINPHFLFNTLNSIASLTLTNPEKAHGMVIALSDFMRYSLRKQPNDMVTLEVELRNIGLYLQIEKIRFGNNLLYRFDVEEACNHHLIPNLILQPLFENAIKYGVYEASKPVEVILEAKKLPGLMEIKLINDFDPESVPLKGEGVGLANINDRLRILYGSSRLLTVMRGESQFSVTMVIPDIAESIR